MTETQLQGQSEFDMSLAQLVARDGLLKPAFGYIAATKATRLVRAAPGGCISPAELGEADGFLIGLEDPGVLGEFMRFGSFATIEIGGETLICERSAVIRTAAVVLPRYQSRFERAALELPATSPVRLPPGRVVAQRPLALLTRDGLTNRAVASALRDLRRVDERSDGVVTAIARAVSGNVGDGGTVAPPALRAGVKYLGWMKGDLLALVAAGFLDVPMAIEAGIGPDGRPRRLRLWRRRDDEPLVRAATDSAPAIRVPPKARALPEVVPAPPPTAVPSPFPATPAARVREATVGLLGPLGALRIAAITERVLQGRRTGDADCRGRRRTARRA